MKTNFCIRMSLFPMPSTLTFTLVLFTLIAVFLSGCSTSSKTDSIKERMAELDTEIKTIIGSAHCTSTVQCHTIGYGDKPCGGFSSYLIYSELNTDVHQLKSSVDQYNKLSSTWNRQNNISSTCDMTIPPPLSCIQQTCR